MYGSLIGSLLYLTATRPDILFVVSLLSRFMHSPRDKHLTTAKRVLRYIKGTSKFGIFFPTSAQVTMKLIGYSGSDWGGGVHDSRSTSGYLLCLGRSFFSQSSRKQETTTQSTAEVEYITFASAVNQFIWLRKMMKDLCVTIVQQFQSQKIQCFMVELNISRSSFILLEKSNNLMKCCLFIVHLRTSQLTFSPSHCQRKGLKIRGKELVFATKMPRRSVRQLAFFQLIIIFTVFYLFQFSASYFLARLSQLQLLNFLKLVAPLWLLVTHVIILVLMFMFFSLYKFRLSAH